MNDDFPAGEMTPALQTILAELSEAVAVLNVARRSLESQEIGSDEAVLIRQSIATLVAAHDRLDGLIQ